MKNNYSLNDADKESVYEYTLFRLSVGGYIIDKRYNAKDRNTEGHKVFVTNNTDNDGTRRAINFTVVKRLLKEKLIAFSHRVDNLEVYVPTELFRDKCSDEIAVVRKTKYTKDFRELIK